MKKLNIIILFGMMTLSFLFFSPLSTNFALASAQGSSEDTLLVGTTSFGLDLDPQNAWDTASFNIIHQVSEGLYTYDLGDKYLREVPRLAADCGSWSDDYLEFYVQLREGITFHNGNPLNASVVKASFDRLNNLVETGSLQTAELYKPMNDELVINRTEIIDEYKFKFVLNYPYFPFIQLLFSTSSRIVDASVMPADDIIAPNEILVGTGPYRIIEINDEKVEFSFYEDYYRGVPAVKNFTFIKYESISAISTALLTGDVDMGDYNPNYMTQFMNSDNLTIEEPKAGSIITFMGMNNVDIDKTMRQAISYAIDYDYIISSIFKNLIIRMTSVIPPGIIYHKPQDVPIYEIEKARQILIDAGLSNGLNNDSVDSEWIALAESATPIARYNYTYNFENTIRQDFGIEIQFELKQIGVKIELDGTTQAEFLTKILFKHKELQLFLYEWRPESEEPSNIINSLFSNTSLANSAQVNDPWLQEKMIEGLSEIDMSKRCCPYFDMQKYIVTDLIPWIFIGFDNGVSVHSIHVTDLQRNAFGYFYVFPLAWYGENASWDEEFYCSRVYLPDECNCLNDTDPENDVNYIAMIAFIGVGVAFVIFIIIIIKKPSIK